MWAELNYGKVELMHTYVPVLICYFIGQIKVLDRKKMFPLMQTILFEKYVQVFAGWLRERL